ncbi:Fic family protein [Desulfovibrio sp.]
MRGKTLVLSADNLQFSRRFDRVRVQPVLARVQTLAAILAELPVLPETAEALDADLRLRSILASAALSGNALGPEQAARALDAAEPPADPAAREIHNLGRALRPLTKPRREFGVMEVAEAHLRKLHAGITEGLDYPASEPGAYRSRSIEVGDESQGGSYVPPRHVQDVRRLMERFAAWINSEPLRHEPPLLRAAICSFHLACIHPFDTGNHRAARALHALILSAAGLRRLSWLPAILEHRAPLESYRASLDSLRHDLDLTAYLDHHLLGLLDQLTEIKARLLAPLARLTAEHHLQALLDQRRISRRQLDLLHLLQEHGRPLTLQQILATRPFSILYRDRTSHSARRDLLNLVEQGLLHRSAHAFSPFGGS